MELEVHIKVYEEEEELEHSIRVKLSDIEKITIKEFNDLIKQASNTAKKYFKNNGVI